MSYVPVDAEAKVSKWRFGEGKSAVSQKVVQRVNDLPS